MIAKCFDVQDMVETINIWKRKLKKNSSKVSQAKW